MPAHLSPHLRVLWRWRSRLRRCFPLLGHGGSGATLRCSSAANRILNAPSRLRPSRVSIRWCDRVLCSSRSCTLHNLDSRIAIMIVSTGTRRAVGWSAKGLLPLALPVTVIVVTIISRRRRRKPTVAAAAGDAAVSVPEQVSVVLTKQHKRLHTASCAGLECCCEAASMARSTVSLVRLGEAAEIFDHAVTKAVV